MAIKQIKASDDDIKGWKEEMKRLDYQTSMLIAGYANLGAHENVVTQVWNVSQNKNGSVMRQLLRKEDVSKLLMDIIRQNIEETKELSKDSDPRP